MKQTETFHGLSSAEAAELSAQGLDNRAVAQRSKSLGEILLGNLFSVFNLMILGVIAFVLMFYVREQDSRLLLDSLGMFLVAFLNTAVAVFQEMRAKRALDKVSLLMKRPATVVRDGKETEIDVETIVKGDLVVIRRGDQAAVDGEVVASQSMEMDESLLTGESMAVFKEAGAEILSGSFCVSGKGWMRTTRVGRDSYAAGVTSLAKKHKFTLTPLQKRINLIVTSLFSVAVILVVVLVGGEILKPSGIAEGDLVRKIATILISLIPQGLVLLSSLAFALGVYRISRIGALVQKLNAIESFSNVRVICMDKTGTLTENRLRVTAFMKYPGSKQTESEIQALVGSFAALSSEQNATITALSVYEKLEGAVVGGEIPFSSANKFSMIKIAAGTQELTVVLGAPDVLVEHCGQASRAWINEVCSSEACRNYRNVLLATLGGELEKHREGIRNAELSPLCMVSLCDTVRTDVGDAIRHFESNGIDLKVLSGDARESIAAVVREIGWNIRPEDMCTGKDIDEADDGELGRLVMDKKVFARLKPEHKLRIIKALKARKIYTAMIGDGVNDLPAIKEADMGIAMEEGSGITKEIADIVLLKNKFSLLPEIFKEGMKIVNSVNTVAKLFLTKNLLVVFMTLLSLIFMLDFPLTPRRVSLINLFGLGIPSLILALANKNDKRRTHFLQDVGSFILISSLVILGTMYAAQHLVLGAGSYTAEVQETMMMSIMVYLFVLNFVVIGLEADPGRKGMYVFGLVMVAAYFVLSIVPFDFAPLHILQVFYEISTLPRELIPLLGASVGAGAALLVVTQVLRSRYVTSHELRPPR